MDQLEMLDSSTFVHGMEEVVTNVSRRKYGRKTSDEQFEHGLVSEVTLMRKEHVCFHVGHTGRRFRFVIFVCFVLYFATVDNEKNFC